MRGKLEYRFDLPTFQENLGVESDYPFIEPDKVIHQVLVGRNGVCIVEVKVSYATVLLVQGF